MHLPFATAQVHTSRCYVRLVPAQPLLVAYPLIPAPQMPPRWASLLAASGHTPNCRHQQSHESVRVYRLRMRECSNSATAAAATAATVLDTVNDSQGVKV
jgi:hypothetical protein